MSASRRLFSRDWSAIGVVVVSLVVLGFASGDEGHGHDDPWLHWTVLIAGLVLSAILAAALGYRYVFADLPTLPADKATLWSLNRPPGMAFYDRNGALIATRGPRHGTAVPLREMPLHVPRAFLAAEDRRFYSHGGVDWRAVARALRENQKAGRTVQGGSTLTQQLVKIILLNPDQTLKRKLQEAVLARELEHRLSKDDILELYLHRAYFGEGAYGVDSAARTYFGKSARGLTLSEAALLAALPDASLARVYLLYPDPWPKRRQRKRRFVSDRALAEIARVLRPVLDDYDVILIDCQPSLGLLTVNALTASHGVIIPLICEFFALRAVALLVDSISKVQDRINPKLQIDGVLATMFDSRTLHSREVMARVVERFSDLVFDTVITRTVRFPETTVAGQPITTWAPTSTGASAYRDLAKEVLAL